MNVYQNENIKTVLSSNTYPGRGIIIGKTPNGRFAAVAYFIMGRSGNSRNRIFSQKGSDVTIYPFDYSKVEDPSLIIYSPIRTVSNHLIVTNGDQTDTIFDFISAGKSFEEALETREFEPDFPNLTPRISGILSFKENDFTYKMSILKSADSDASGCNRYTFSYFPVDGVGHFIHTYNCDGDPIPTFTGEPKRIEISDDIDTFTKSIWDNLNEQNKISLFVRFVELSTGKTQDKLINKYCTEV